MKTTQRKAVSPVIATVILVAVAITVSIGVSYWMSGISSQYTNFEKVEITNVVITKDAFANWVVSASLKNSGSATATINSLFVNEMAVTISAVAGTPLTAPIAIVATLTADMESTGLTLESGEELPLIIWIGGTAGKLSPGTTINLKFHSASGMDYITLEKLS